MKKIALLIGLALTFAPTISAERQDVSMKHQRKSTPDKNTGYNRAPLHLPIDVVFDTDTQTLEVTGDESMDAEVYIYNSDGALEDYSSTINANFVITIPGDHLIHIEGDGWYSDGTFTN